MFRVVILMDFKSLSQSQVFFQDRPVWNCSFPLTLASKPVPRKKDFHSIIMPQICFTIYSVFPGWCLTWYHSLKVDKKIRHTVYTFYMASGKQHVGHVVCVFCLFLSVFFVRTIFVVNSCFTNKFSLPSYKHLSHYTKLDPVYYLGYFLKNIFWH